MIPAPAIVAKNIKNVVERIVKYTWLFKYRIINYNYIYKEKYTIIPKST